MANARTVSAADFKARCLGLLDEVAQTRLPLLVTKRGKPVARVVAIDDAPAPSLLGSVRYSSEEDLLAPVDLAWDAEQ
jgi:prevent-host-death family protein